MRVRVLGSAAGGGFPQWNCNCLPCRSVRDGSRPARPRTQASIAVTTDGVHWLLVNASPDIRTQLLAAPALGPPTDGVRGTALGAIVLTNADVDHIGGLLSLREFQPLQLYATAQVHAWMFGPNAIFNVLHSVPHQCDVTPLVPGTQQWLTYRGGVDAGMGCATLPVRCKVPGWLRGARGTAETLALKLIDRASGAALAYVPGVREFGDELRAFIADCAVLFFDGSFWDDDELPRLGLADKTARALGHMPMSGPDGSLARLADLPRVRRIYTHINNTNPVLLEDSLEYAQMRACGWELAYDGMELHL